MSIDNAVKMKAELLSCYIKTILPDPERITLTRKRSYFHEIIEVSHPFYVASIKIPRAEYAIQMDMDRHISPRILDLINYRYTACEIVANKLTDCKIQCTEHTTILKNNFFTMDIGASVIITYKPKFLFGSLGPLPFNEHSFRVIRAVEWEDELSRLMDTIIKVEERNNTLIKNDMTNLLNTLRHNLELGFENNAF